MGYCMEISCGIWGMRWYDLVMKRSRKLTIIAALVLLALGIVSRCGVFHGIPVLNFFDPRDSFVRKWSGKLLALPTVASAEEFFKARRPEGLVVKMKDGSWISIVMEHSCCNGAGYDVVLYVTSTGERYVDWGTCYCGEFALENTIDYNEYSTESTAAFLGAVRAGGIQLVKL